MREEAASDTRQPGFDKAVNDEAPSPGGTLRKKLKILQAAKEAAPNPGATEAVPAAGAERFVTELDRARTGKTGVAFGLLRCRPGSRDVRIDDENRVGGEAAFAWYLGSLDDDDNFYTVILPNGEYGEWNRFDYADENCFYLYYTSEPRAAEPGKLPKKAVKCLYCSLDEDEVSDSADAAVYIRKVDPNTIEYAAGRPEDFFEPEAQLRIHRLELR